MSQRRWQEELERQPVQFFLGRYPEALTHARREAAAFVGVPPECFAFVSNASSGVNAVLRSLRLEPGDELLTTNHTYAACSIALSVIAERAGARLVVAPIDFPAHDQEKLVSQLLECVTTRTRLCLLDHVTSYTGTIFPVERWVRELRAMGVETLIDGAHAPGMVELDVAGLGAGYYAGNFHKWVSAAKGSAFLYVREDLQRDFLPLVISHGRSPAWNEVEASSYSQLCRDFDWPGTVDPSAWLTVPDAIRDVAALVPGGWTGVRQANRELALKARELLANQLSVAPPVPADWLGSLVTLPLPPGSRPAKDGPFAQSPLKLALWERHRIEVPIFEWPSSEHRWVRVSAHLYNTLEDYQKLAAALITELSRGL